MSYLPSFLVTDIFAQDLEPDLLHHLPGQEQHPVHDVRPVGVLLRHLLHAYQPACLARLGAEGGGTAHVHYPPSDAAALDGRGLGLRNAPARREHHARRQSGGRLWD